MGVYIDVYIYNYVDLRARLVDAGAGSGHLIDDILRACGTLLGDDYVICNNEHDDEYNPYYIVSHLLDSAFDMKDSFNVFVGLGEHQAEKRRGISGIDEYDVAEKLGITLSEED